MVKHFDETRDRSFLYVQFHWYSPILGLHWRSLLAHRTHFLQLAFDQRSNLDGYILRHAAKRLSARNGPNHGDSCSASSTIPAIHSADRPFTIPAVGIRIYRKLGQPNIELSCAAESPARSEPQQRHSYEKEDHLRRQLQRFVGSLRIPHPT
jgi:hypothetical protein